MDMQIVSKRALRISVIEMLVCSFLWSIAGIFIKLIDWHPFVIAGFRSLIAAATVLVFMKIRKNRIVFSKNVFKSMIFLSFTFIAFVTANKLTTAANAIVLQFTAPVFILIFSALFKKQKLKGSDIAVVGCTLFGIMLFFFDSLDYGNMIGNLVGLLSGLLMGSMFMAVGETKETERMSGIFFGHLLTAIIGIPVILFTDFSISFTSVGAILVLGVIQLGIPYILFALAVQNCPPFACSILSALEPLCNPVWVFIFDGEAPGVFALIGGVIVIVSITVWCVARDRKAA